METSDRKVIIHSMLNSLTIPTVMVGNDVATTGVYGFRVRYKTDVRLVKVETATSVLTPFTVDVDFTVNGVDSPDSGNWTYTLTTPLPTGFKAYAYPQIPFNQLDRFSQQFGSLAETIEKAIDRIVVRQAQQQYELDRTVKFQVGTSATTPEEFLETLQNYVIDAESSASTASTQAGIATTQATNAANSAATAATAASYYKPIAFGHRLTLVSGTPVMTTQVTAATTLYLTPYLSDAIDLYSGTAWARFSSNEISITLASLAANTNFDVFVYNNAGTPTLELTAWTNDTTRATNITRQDGVYVKVGATTRRYVGTIRTTGTIGQCEFTTKQASATGGTSKRFVWNMYNRVTSEAITVDTTDSWTYGTLTYRAANNSSTHRHQFVIGLTEDEVVADYAGAFMVGSTDYEAWLAVGLDSTSSPAAFCHIGYGQVYTNTMARLTSRASWRGHTAIGYHYLAPLEMATAGTAATFYGDRATGERLSSFLSSTKY